MFELILSLLETGLALWLSKEKTKYIDKKMELQRAYYAEYNKPLSERSDAALDNLYFELRVLAIAFMSDASSKKGSDEVS